jgi:hypothetical protein
LNHHELNEVFEDLWPSLTLSSQVHARY